MNSSIKYSFQDSFWSRPIDNIPQFSQSISILHQKLSQSMEENEAIIEYIKQRIHAEEQYASILNACKKSEATINNIFDRDIGASLKQCFQEVRQESQLSAEAHQSRASNLRATALEPVTTVSKKYSKIIANSKTNVLNYIQRFEKQVQLTNQAKSNYDNKCKKIIEIQPDYKPIHELPILLSNISWSYSDLVSFLKQMEQTYQPLLGKHLLKEMISHYSKHNNITNNNTVDVNRNAEIACQQLLDKGWILNSSNSINQEDEQLLDTSIKADTTDSNSFIIYSDIIFTLHIPQSSSSIDNYLIPISSSSTTSPNSNGFWNKKKIWPSKQTDTLSSLINEMDTTNQHYQQAVKQLEILRLENEEILFMHFEEMETLELERIQTIKQAFISMAATFSNTIPIYKDLYDEMMLYQETLNPEKDIQAIIEQYRIGKFCPRPILYENYFYGLVNYQLFGVPLQNVIDNEQTHVPLLLENGLLVIETALPQLLEKERNKIWIAPLPLDLIHKVRNDLNSMMTPITQDVLKKYDIILLASIIRLYLLELPDCLVTFELYEPIKLLYANENQDSDSHLISISKLMTTLPTVNYETLKSLLKHLQKLINTTDDSTFIQSLVYRFSHIIIRADTATSANKHDRHPHRFVRDLLEHFDILFSKEVDHGQSIHHQRQQQQKQQRSIGSYSRHSSLDNYSNKLPSLDSSSSVTSTLSSIHFHSTEDIIDHPKKQPKEEKKDEMNVSSSDTTATASTPQTSKRSFLSYVKRSSTLPYSMNDNNNNSNNNSGFKFTPSLSRSKSTITSTDHSSSIKRPMLIPSRSTLFEDPDIDLTPSVEFMNHNSIKHHHHHNNDVKKNINEIVPLPSLSKASKKSIDDNDDHISIDSFFL
ncbi:unnamed protein product [Cunninghamella blakesleeana]